MEDQEISKARETVSQLSDSAKQKMSLDYRAKLQSSRIKLKTSWLCFLVILSWIAVLQGIAVAFFTRGFLLSRPVFEDVSSCEDFNSSLQGESCWMPRSFDRAVIVVIDALRFDFVVPGPESDQRYFHDKFPYLLDYSLNHPQNALLLKFIADPPTTTLQRLKGLTTGSLPTFIDAGSNFAGTDIDEDNWVKQLRMLNKTIAFMGDDTWTALFSSNFHPNLTFPYESLNVWDLFTVDNGVKEHMFPLLQSESESDSKWDVLIAHLLGVDHAGHRYGPDHPSMASKLEEMDQMIHDITSSIDDSTLLIVMGDHGMDPKGDHGGESQPELESTLWMYSKQPIFGRVQDRSLYNTSNGGSSYRSVAQIDLVSTISLLLGSAVPFNNLGFPIDEAFLGPESNDIQRLATAQFLTAQQIQRYQSKFGQEDQEKLGNWENVLNAAQEQDWSRLSDASFRYQHHVSEEFRKMWVQFDMASIFIGLILMACSLWVILAFNSVILSLDLDDKLQLTKKITTAASTSGVFFYISARVFQLETFRYLGLGISSGVFLAFLSQPFMWRSLKLVKPSLWTVFPVLLTIAHAIIFTSNSYTVWEDKVVAFLTTTFGVVILVYSVFGGFSSSAQVLGIFHSIIFLILTRMASFSTLCREEQAAYCISTFYGSESSSVPSPFSLGLMALTALYVPYMIKSFLKTSASYTGAAPFWIGWGLRATLGLVVLYWALYTMEARDSLKGINPLHVDAFKLLIARSVLGITLLAANYAWYLGFLCIKVILTGQADQSSSKRQAQLLGYSNIYGSYYLLFVCNIFAAVLMVSKPMGGFSLGLLLYQILTLIELSDILNLHKYPHLIPVILGLLGTGHFFSTGHQATLPSIQWDIGFVPSSTITFPLTHIALTLNTFGPFILTGICVPLITFWKIPPAPDSQPLLAAVIRPILSFVAYHTTVTLSSMIWAAYFRRHLMVWKIFAPRFMLSALTLVVVDIVVIVLVVAFAAWRSVSHIDRINSP